MAAGSFNLTKTGNTSSYLSFIVDWNSSSNGSIDNSSTVHVAVYAVKSSASTSNTWGTTNTSVSVTDGGTQYENGLALNVAPGSSQLIFAKNFTVKHDDNGKKSITIDVDVGGDVAWGNGSINVELDTIPRASSIAVANYNLGQNISITIGKKNNSFTSILTYKIGERIGTIATKISEASYVWEMSDELIIQIKQDNPSNKNISATIYCETYSDDTKVGDTQPASFTLVIVDKPTISDVVIDETIELIKQYTTSIVKYLSVPQFNITANPSEGTTISTYKVKINDREINSSTNELTISNIQYSYLVEDVRKTKFIVTVTDARGNISEEYPIEVDFVEYVQLAFNNTDIKLTRLNGTSNFIKLHMTGYIYNGLIGETQNTLALTYRYKLKNDSTTEWSELKTIEATLNADNTFIIDNLQLEDEFDYRKNYDIEFYIQDVFLSKKYETVIKTSETIAKWHKNGAYIKELTCKKAKIFPIGSIYMATENFNPNDYFFGNWEQIKDVFLLSAGDIYTAGSMGGEAKHTLTINEMPSHKHNMGIHHGDSGSGVNAIQGSAGDYNWAGTAPLISFPEATGGNQPHNNMPPYLVVYMWKRIS